MPYRIEVAKQGRAGCTDTVCKKNNAKIGKGELRLGSWVEIGGEHGSWKWRHWGCVSGFTITNMREDIMEGDDEYEWDKIDGYDELEDQPEIQEKIQRVMKQGHIDPEDFNGDPEFNKPGQKAIRPRATKAKAAKDDTKAPAKRGRKKAADDDEDEEEEAQPAKKKAKSSRKSQAADDEEEAKPAKKATVKGGRKSKAGPPSDEEEEEDKPQPSIKKAKAGRKSKAVEDVKEEEEEEEKPAKKAAKRGRKSKAAADADDDQQEPQRTMGYDGQDEDEPEPAPKAKAKRGRKSITKAAAAEDIDEDDIPLKPAATKSKRGRSSK